MLKIVLIFSLYFKCSETTNVSSCYLGVTVSANPVSLMIDTSSLVRTNCLDKDNSSFICMKVSFKSDNLFYVFYSCGSIEQCNSVNKNISVYCCFTNYCNSAYISQITAINASTSTSTTTTTTTTTTSTTQSTESTNQTSLVISNTTSSSIKIATNLNSSTTSYTNLATNTNNTNIFISELNVTNLTTFSSSTFSIKQITTGINNSTNNMFGASNTTKNASVTNINGAECFNLNYNIIFSLILLFNVIVIV